MLRWVERPQPKASPGSVIRFLVQDTPFHHVHAEVSVDGNVVSRDSKTAAKNGRRRPTKLNLQLPKDITASEVEINVYSRTFGSPRYPSHPGLVATVKIKNGSRD